MKKPKKNIQDFGIFKKKNKYKKKALENFRICEKNLADSDTDRHPYIFLIIYNQDF